MNSIKDLNIVITGASSGLGAYIAKEVAKNGAIPILIARREDKLIELSTQILELYQIKSPIFQLDITNESDVEEIFEQIYHSVGNIDVLINNAGFGIFKSFESASVEEVKSMFDVNVFGLVTCTKQVINQMKANDAGQIINIASMAGKIATPKSSAYGGSKYAVLGITNALRMELMNTNIQVTAINPGPIRTEFFDIADVSGNYVKNMGRLMLEPEYVAKKVVSTIGTKKREISLPRWMGMGPIIYSLFPKLFEKISASSLNKK